MRLLENLVLSMQLQTLPTIAFSACGCIGFLLRMRCIHAGAQCRDGPHNGALLIAGKIFID
jgi:hypothetical protein